MSNPPRKRASALAKDDVAATPAKASPIGKLPPLSERLPGMSDHQLLAHQMSANRFAGDPRHPKHAQALHALPLIEAEVRRRAANLNTRPAEQDGE